MEALRVKPVHEPRMAAVFMLELDTDPIGMRDLKPIERLIRDPRACALVDGLAANVLGELLARHPELGDGRQMETSGCAGPRCSPDSSR